MFSKQEKGQRGISPKVRKGHKGTKPISTADYADDTDREEGDLGFLFVGRLCQTPISMGGV